MTQWRATGAPCPIDELPLGMDKCEQCRFYRGASLVTRPPESLADRGWRVACNWPRHGSETVRTPMPEWMGEFELPF